GFGIIFSDGHVVELGTKHHVSQSLHYVKIYRIDDPGRVLAYILVNFWRDPFVGSMPYFNLRAPDSPSQRQISWRLRIATEALSEDRPIDGSIHSWDQLAWNECRALLSQASQVSKQLWRGIVPIFSE